jgi:hypothetical protein
MNRDGMVCTRCGYRFVLNPKRYPYLTDGRALALVGALSRDGTRAFTPRQVFGAAAARQRLFWWTRAAPDFEMQFTVDDLIRLSVQQPAAFARMLVSPRLADSATTVWPEPDMYDYGAERILVVDEPIVVDLLIEVGVHTSARAMVLDVGGYPLAVTALARELLRQRPDVPIGMLHASDTDVEAMRARIQSLLETSTAIIDVGLAPSAAHMIKALRWARRLRQIPVDALPHWLLSTPLSEALSTDTPLGSRLLTGEEREKWYRSDHSNRSDRSDGDYG